MVLAQATEALKITSPELINFGVMDEIIPEPLGGAHSDPMASFPYIKEAILNVYNTRCAHACLQAVSLFWVLRRTQRRCLAT